MVERLEEMMKGRRERIEKGSREGIEKRESFFKSSGYDKSSIKIWVLQAYRMHY